MIAPPKPPSQQELEALIREARERQLRRRLLGAAAIAVAAAVSLGIYALSDGGSPVAAPDYSHPGRLTQCPLRELTLALQTQGTATQSVTFLTIGNPRHLACSLSAPAVFEITENGRSAPIVGNPLRVRLHTTLHGTRRKYLAVPGGIWWGNWCGSRKGLRMTAHVGPRSLDTRFSVLPDCLQPSHESTLFAASAGPR